MMENPDQKFNSTEFSFLKGNVRIMLTEWIPFGLNNIISLNDKLETSSENKHTLLTESIDFRPETSTFETSPDLSRVRVVESERTEYVEFVSDVPYHTSAGDMQSEQIGIHVDKSGRVTYGMEIIETKGVKNKHSLDSLSRVVADLVEDSSRVMDTVINNYQKRLLNLVYSGMRHQREKFVIITADEIEPNFNDLEKYLHTSHLTSEINQVITKAYKVFSLADESKIVLGDSGLILITRYPDHYKHILVLYPLLNSIRTFQSNVFARLEMTMDNLNYIRKIITKGEYDSISKLIEEITLLSGNVIMFEAIFSFVQECLDGIAEQLQSLVNLNEFELEFMKHTENDVVLENIRARVEDAKFIVDGLEKEITSLEELSSTLNEKELKNVFSALRENTAHSVGIGEALELLEAGILGIYVLEFLNIAMETSGTYDHDPAGGMLILPLAFWIVVCGGLAGVYGAWRLLQRIKHRTIERVRKRFG